MKMKQRSSQNAKKIHMKLMSPAMFDVVVFGLNIGFSS
jgi:hypothetical protein